MELISCLKTIILMISFINLLYCSLAEQLESIYESMDEYGMSALNSFFECKKVHLPFLILLYLI